MRKPPTIILLLAGILILGAFFRFYDLAVLPPGLYPDEAVNGTNALEAIHSGNFRVFYPDNNGREGLFINIQALSVWLFGNEPWSLRVVSAIFGVLTILGVYLATKELLKNYELGIMNKGRNENHNSLFLIPYSERIALLSSFFLATSYWHINFSRIGFRAITVPFFASFGIYWLLKGLRTGKISSIMLAGIFIGLGFHTYIAFRFMPFILAVPILFALIQWRHNKNNELGIMNKGQNENHNSLFLIPNSASCVPCAVILFLFITFVVALPIGWHFLQNPGDFFGRGGQISVFAAEQPLYEFVKSNLITLQMFFWVGDCNPRHNLACQPQLNPIVALFFIIGIIIAIRELRTNKELGIMSYEDDDIKSIIPNSSFIILFAWFFFMTLPASLTTEGLPHALRAIGMIPPIMILAGIGAYESYAYLQNMLTGYAQNPRLAERTQQISRIQKELLIVFLLLLTTIAFATYRAYFVQFEKARATYPAFRADVLNMARYIDTLPTGTDIYVLANYQDTRYGIPIEAEVVQYITDTARTEEQNAKHIWYLLPEELERMQASLDAGGRTELIPMNPREKGGVKGLLAQFPELKLEVMNDFAVLRNYQR